jgi:hypothetical protein
MRPVSKPHLPDAAFGLSADALLFHALGEYCSFCERPLSAENWVWHKRLGTDSRVAEAEAITGERLIPWGPRPIEPSDWPNVLLLDWNCYLAQRDRRGGKAPDLLMPDEERPCFRLDGDSPITYELRRVTVVVIDDEGRVLNQDPDELVIAIGHDADADAMIEHFQLNSRYFSAADHEFRLPEFDALSLADRRVQQRTAVWRRATRLARSLNDRRDDRSILFLIENARLAIAAAGFWATWATVLWKELHGDRDLLRRLLLPLDLDWTVGPGPHNLFPGTRQDWLQ